ncbi:MAG TPA: hypothetical protein DCM73_01540 [Clostridiales bacterium]|nr:hypothetical protein [Clostridiales bacterium]
MEINNNSIKELKENFLKCINVDKFNCNLRKEFILDGIIANNAYYINGDENKLGFNLEDEYGFSLKVYISDKNKLSVHKEDLKSGNRVTIKCIPYINRNGYIHNYDILQVRAIGVDLQFDYENCKTESAKKIKDLKNVRRLNFYGKETIGVYIVAPNGESLHDVQESFKNNNFFKLYCQIVNTSDASEIASAIQDANESDIEIIVITRGGIENLQVFDDELIINEILKSHKYIITAIGHTRSHTLSDDAADVSLNAPVEVGTYLINEYNKFRYREQNVNQESSNAQTCNNRGNKKYVFIMCIIIFIVMYFSIKVPIFSKILENIIP